MNYSREQLYNFIENIINILGCPLDYHNENFYKGVDDPNYSDFYFTICKGSKYLCKKTDDICIKCWLDAYIENEESGELNE